MNEVKKNYNFPEVKDLDKEFESLIKQLNRELKLIYKNQPTQTGGSGYVELRTDSGYIQWRNDPNGTWQNLVSLASLQGAPGTPGAPGAGLPTGGAVGQIIKKKSLTDYDTEWTNLNEGKVGSKTVNESSIGNDKILVYKTAGDEFVFEAKPTGSVFNVPAASYFNISRDAASVTAVFEDGIGALCLTGISTASTQDRISFRGRSVSAPFTIIGAINWRCQTTNHRQGLMLSDGTRYMLIGNDNKSITTGGYAPSIMFYSTISSYLSYPYNNSAQNNHQHGLMFFKIEDNGTNLIISMSIGGAGWRQLYSASRTALFPSGVTEAGIGLAYYGNTGGEGNMIALKHWSLT